jgi:hypothetical protein
MKLRICYTYTEQMRMKKLKAVFVTFVKQKSV